MNLPNRTMEDVMVFTATCKSDPRETFTISASTETHAKYVLLDKVGYVVIEYEDTGDFCVVDADDHDSVEFHLLATSLVAALDEAITKTDWVLGEPTQLIGGSMGSGFGFEEQN